MRFWLGGKRTVDAGPATTQSYDLKGFTGVKVAGPDDVTIRQGEAFAITAKGPTAIIDELEIELDGDMLSVGRKKSGFSFSHRDDDGVRIEVTMPKLVAARLTGSGSIDADTLDGDAVVVRGVPAHLRHCVDDADVADLIARIVPWLRMRTRKSDASAVERGLLAAGRSAVLTYGPDGQRRGEGMEVFVAAHAPRPRMLVFGAIDFAAAVARQGAFLGYRVTVCDARPVFATAARFPGVDEVVVDWPHRYLAGQVAAGTIDAQTVICVLTHDPKFDIPVLEIALRLPELAYVGAMGSRRTHADRLDRLRAAGLTEAEVDRLHSPIGLDLGGRTPEETAVSVAAEIIAARWGGGGRPLAQTDGPIHAE